MGAAPFRFLSDEDFLRLDATDTDKTVPIAPDRPVGTKPGRRK